MRVLRVLAFSGVLGALLWSCTGAGPAVDTTPSPPTGADSNTTQATTTTTLAPEQAHIFEGEWLLTYTLETASEDFFVGLDPGDRDIRLLKVMPQCDLGPCDLDAEFRTPYREGEPTPGTITWTGSTYETAQQLTGRASCTGDGGEVFDEGLDLTTTITLEPSGFEMSDRGWLVSELIGRRVIDWTPNPDAAASGCGSFSEEYSVLAAPFDPDVFSFPVSDPLPAGAIAYRVSGAELRGLSVVSPDGAIQQVPDIPLHFDISPDGRSIVYADAGSLWLASANGSEARELFVDDRVAFFSEVAWSADGTRVAFVRSNRDEGADVWYVEVPYGVPERVTEGGFALGGVTWGPDTSLIFDWGINEEDDSTDPATLAITSSIYVYDFDTGETTELISPGFRPHVAANGAVLSYLVPDLDSRGRPFRWTIRVANVDGSADRSVVTASLFGGCASVQSIHAVGIPCRVPVSPDGSTVVFATGSCEGCVPGAFSSPGVWQWGVSTGERTLVAEDGVYPQWVVGSGGSDG